MRLTGIFVFILISSLSYGQNIQRLWNQKNYAAVYAQLDRIDRMSGQDMLRVAQAAQHFGEDSIAIEILNLSIEKGYATDQTYYQRGICLFEGQKYTAAAESFHQALALNKNRLPYMLAKADAYYRGNQPDSALAVFERVHHLFPDRDVASFMMCKIPEEQGFVVKAIRCYEVNIRGIKEEGYKLESIENLALLQWRSNRDTASAEQNLLHLTELKPNNFKYRMLLTQLYGETESWQKLNAQRLEIVRIYAEGNAPNNLVRKNMYPLLEVMGQRHRIQIFEVLRPELNHGILFKAFFVTPTQAIPVGSLSYGENNGQFLLEGEGVLDQVTPPEGNMTLQELIIYMKRIESKL